MKLVKIIAASSVRYSSDNGLTLTEYEAGGVYEVADHVARGMARRGQARLFDPKKDAPPESGADSAGEAGAVAAQEARQELSKPSAARDVAERPAPAASGGASKPSAATTPEKPADPSTKAAPAPEPRRKGGKP
jgi:hypothetical protein